ncbi:carboxy-S-adenosyl-L-methionine synthase CmoA [Pseudidiomarina sp. 1APP75-32.1]|uniref:Carboxy-S-adenosyl-L-methionine synthase n=1 Tax=Pseudidiomarina terrestris TaxID=2820060 RepID=A0AAW7QWN2_9GAMM|nr:MULTISPECIES: carboxy-S-adenosyl-L-methionine synthase CmoA [unclassified Pseudidiomarina]MDN7124625.1 carboxy-S-adenosyl-L-methionine synthase CmoA [Pseudidiomarina sp. 1APP75-32.1]MDN7129084.1 carboxy-S-adenosyl-L-methionine synthase CmoA [Pseudidiomarina sp. 1APR75-15]
MHESKKDAIFAEPLTQVSDFVFDQRVVEVFPDMINRSVPGYQSILHGIGQLTQRFAQPDSTIYDLGCSLGAATLAMRQNLAGHAGVKIIAADNSAAMVERCRLHLQGYRSDTPAEVVCTDVRELAIDNASVVTMNFTLQFIPQDERQQLLQRIYSGLNPGGVLLLSEKFKSDNEQLNEVLVDLHHEFKRANGYSELEISQKRAAIENVMRVDSLTTHQQRLQDAGFKAVQVWFQCYNFAALLAVK